VMTQRSDFHAALRLAFLLEAQDDLPDVLEVAASTASVRRKGRRVTSLRCISLCSGTIFNFQTHPSPPIHSIKYSATRRLGYHAANTSTVLLVQGLEGHWEDDVWSFLILKSRYHNHPLAPSSYHSFLFSLVCRPFSACEIGYSASGSW